MSITEFTPSFYPATYYGGPIYSSYELAKILKQQNIDIKVITTNANGKEKLKIKTGVFHKLENDLPVKYYNSLDSKGTSVTMLLNLSKEIKNTDIVYLISIFSPLTPFVIMLCRLLHKPLIISPRGQLGTWCLSQGNRFKKLWLYLFIKPYIRSLYWHSTSQEEEQNILAVYLNAKTFVLPNGINIREYDNIETKKDKLFFRKYADEVSENSKIIISMGRLQKVKGFDILIEAFSKVQAIFKDAILCIAGDDFGEKANLLKLISSEHLEDKIFLVGHIEREEKISFLRNADVFALPSNHENFGMVYGEALAAGTPIVASTKTPWQDVEKYNCGKCVENTPEVFADAIIQVLNSDAVQMGKNGRKYVEDNFSWDKIGKEFKEQIEKILNEKAR